METTKRNRALRLTLKIGLGGLAMLLWHAPSAKAQECCPDQYTAAELAKAETATKIPAKSAMSGAQQNKPVLVAKREPRVASGVKATRKENPTNSSAIMTVQQAVNSKEKQD